MAKTAIISEALLFALVKELALAASVYEWCQGEFARQGDRAYADDLRAYRRNVERLVRKLRDAVPATRG